MNIIQQINKRATWKGVVFLFCTSAILSTCIVTMFFGKIQLNPDAAMDSLSFYSSETFFNNLDLQGETGRKAYLLLHLIDYLFITQFYILFVFIINILSRKITDTNKIAFLSLIPLFSAAMDLLENILIDISILMYPQRIIMLGSLSGIFTFLKMNSIYVIFLIILILLLLIIIKAIKNRIVKA